MIIAIDGPAAAGKGTLARRIAAALDLPYLDTGLLYRAVGRLLLDAGQDPADPLAATEAAKTLTEADLARADLRGPDADMAASQVASIPGVRAALLHYQRHYGNKNGAVLDGRDIGTIVFPDADIKLFVTASVDARAAPLKPAADATLFDTTHMDAETAFSQALELIRNRRRSAENL